jgi:tetraacyldisaccharide 4'-kinase
VGRRSSRAAPFRTTTPYSAAEASALAAEAASLEALLVTTEKDAVRLAPLGTAEPRLSTLSTLPVTLAFEKPDEVVRLLSRALDAGQATPFGSGLCSRRNTASGDA